MRLQALRKWRAWSKAWKPITSAQSMPCVSYVRGCVVDGRLGVGGEGVEQLETVLAVDKQASKRGPTTTTEPMQYAR